MSRMSNVIEDRKVMHHFDLFNSIRTELYYTKGSNTFNQKRGYYITINLVYKSEVSEGYISVRQRTGDPIATVLIKEASRFSQKTFDKLVQEMENSKLVKTLQEEIMKEGEVEYA